MELYRVLTPCLLIIFPILSMGKIYFFIIGLSLGIPRCLTISSDFSFCPQQQWLRCWGFRYVVAAIAEIQESVSMCSGGQVGVAVAQGADPGKVHNPQRRRAKHLRSRCRGTDRRNQRDRWLGHGDCQSDSQQLKVVTPLLKSQLLQKPPCNLMSHVALQMMCLSKLSYYK